MPNRVLRDYTDSLRFDGISAEAERLFIRLLTKADDYGRFHADLRLVCAACFPLDRTIEPKHADKWLSELEARGLVIRYEADGKACLAIVNYGQRLKNSRVKFPPLPGQPADWLPVYADFPELPGTSRNFRLESQSQSQTNSETLGNPIAVAGATASVKKQALPDEEWLTALETDPAYAGIEVRREFAKMSRWCETNRKQATRRRFVNWLNRADKPLAANAAPLAQRKPASVWELTKALEATEKELGRIQANPDNKHAPDPAAPWEMRLKPEAKTKIQELRERANGLRQRIAQAGQEAA